jgi:rhamnosyltransferase
LDSIAAGIVLYNPDLVRLKENVDAIYNQVKLLVLVDNNSNNINSIESGYSGNKKIIIIKNNSNFGISKALNQIMAFCEAKGYEWVLTLDQDSICPSNMIEEYKKYIEIPDIAIISPIIVDRNTTKSSEEKKYNNSYELIDECITSAALTNVLIWKEISGFDEYMFIDLVDHEYCKRVRINGNKIIRVNTVILLHEMGHVTQHKFLGKEVNVMNHSAFRKYYMARNTLYCAKKHKEFGSVIYAYIRISTLILRTLLYEQNKWGKICKIIQGIKDGIKRT